MVHGFFEVIVSRECSAEEKANVGEWRLFLLLFCSEYELNYLF